MFEVEGIFEILGQPTHRFPDRLHAPLETAQESEQQAEQAGDGLPFPCAPSHRGRASAALQVLSGTSKGLVNIQAGGEMAQEDDVELGSTAPTLARKDRPQWGKPMEELPTERQGDSMEAGVQCLPGERMVSSLDSNPEKPRRIYPSFH